MSIFDHYRQRYEEAKDEELSIQEFLDLCRKIAALMPMRRNVC